MVRWIQVVRLSLLSLSVFFSDSAPLTSRLIERLGYEPNRHRGSPGSGRPRSRTNSVPPWALRDPSG